MCDNDSMLSFSVNMAKYIHVMYGHHRCRSCKICTGPSDHTDMKSSKTVQIFVIANQIVHFKNNFPCFSVWFLLIQEFHNYVSSELNSVLIK